MPTAPATTCKYTAGQRVEVLAADFTIPGFPYVWFAATVTDVTPRDGGLFDVSIKADRGTYEHQIVGKRGGNRNIRSLA